ncbi:hypothetical protein Airi02_056720 [Actinoallomurus iriomotensis]|uniref:Uncharacterized protein n=1 Tax=Actinoallomurus iriomotensis TaxID=478107 RepID=A0A9W6VWF4_9ACTN|nr:hypothetical protein Airi02_056720 [Actinoallomurus iriomotensis]
MVLAAPTYPAKTGEWVRTSASRGLAVAAHIPPNCEAADALHSSVKSRHLIGAGFLRSDRSHRPFVRR